jgi:hypothetical protein
MASYLLMVANFIIKTNQIKVKMMVNLLSLGYINPRKEFNCLYLGFEKAHLDLHLYKSKNLKDCFLLCFIFYNLLFFHHYLCFIFDYLI